MGNSLFTNFSSSLPLEVFLGATGPSLLQFIQINEVCINVNFHSALIKMFHGRLCAIQMHYLFQSRI